MLSDKEYIAFCCAILLAFDKEIDKGFHIPGAFRLENKVLSSLDKIKLSKKLKNGFREIVFHYGNDRSYLSTFLLFTERLYSDWRYGYGTLYSRKPGEKKMAL